MGLSMHARVLRIFIRCGTDVREMRTSFDGDCSPHNDRINIKIVLHGTRGDDKMPNAWWMRCYAENKIDGETSANRGNGDWRTKISLYAWRLDAPCSLYTHSGVFAEHTAQSGSSSSSTHRARLFAHSLGAAVAFSISFCESVTLVPESLNTRRARDII